MNSFPGLIIYIFAALFNKNKTIIYDEIVNSNNIINGFYPFVYGSQNTRGS